MTEEQENIINEFNLYLEKIKQIDTAYGTSGKIWSVDGKALLGNCDGENFDYSEINFKVLPKSLKLCFIKA